MKFLHLTNFKLLSHKKERQQIIVIFPKLNISLRGGHFNYRPREPQSLATPLIANVCLGEFLHIAAGLVSALHKTHKTINTMEFITLRYWVINLATRVTFCIVTCRRRSSCSSNSARHISHIHSLLTFRSVCFMYHPTFCTSGRSLRPVVLIASGKQCTGLSDAGSDVTRHPCTYKSNMVARSRNHSCRGRAIRIIQGVPGGMDKTSGECSLC